MRAPDRFGQQHFVEEVADALIRMNIININIILVIIIVSAAVGLMLWSGVWSDLSILKEYANRGASFWREAQTHVALAFGSLAAATIVGVPLGILCYRRYTLRAAVLNLDDPETRALSETVPPDKQAVVGAGETVLVRPRGDAEATGSVHKDHTGLGAAALHKGSLGSRADRVVEVRKQLAWRHVPLDRIDPLPVPQLKHREQLMSVEGGFQLGRLGTAQPGQRQVRRKELGLPARHSGERTAVVGPAVVNKGDGFRRGGRRLLVINSQNASQRQRQRGCLQNSSGR